MVLIFPPKAAYSWWPTVHALKVATIIIKIVVSFSQVMALQFVTTLYQKVILLVTISYFWRSLIVFAPLLLLGKKVHIYAYEIYIKIKAEAFANLISFKLALASVFILIYIFYTSI